MVGCADYQSYECCMDRSSNKARLRYRQNRMHYPHAALISLISKYWRGKSPNGLHPCYTQHILAFNDPYVCA